MGFFRGGLLIILSILLLVSLIGLNSFFIVSSSLEYDNVREGLVNLVSGEGVLEEAVESFGFEEGMDSGVNLSEIEEEVFDLAKAYCVNSTDYVFSREGYTIEIPCEIVVEGKGRYSNPDWSGILFQEEMHAAKGSCFSRFDFDRYNPWSTGNQIVHLGAAVSGFTSPVV